MSDWPDLENFKQIYEFKAQFPLGEWWKMGFTSQVQYFLDFTN
jgi:hypothetical protein